MIDVCGRHHAKVIRRRLHSILIPNIGLGGKQQMRGGTNGRRFLIGNQGFLPAVDTAKCVQGREGQGREGDTAKCVQGREGKRRGYSQVCAVQCIQLSLTRWASRGERHGVGISCRCKGKGIMLLIRAQSRPLPLGGLWRQTTAADPSPIFRSGKLP